MEFSEQFIKDNGFQEAQITALKGYLETEIVPTIKKEFDGKANENAEGILSGASKYAMQKLGVSVDRQQGEKWGDYLQRVFEQSNETKQNELALKEKEIQDKLANFKGGDEYKAQLQKLQDEKDALLKQVAELEPLKGFDEKYKQATEQLTTMQKQVAYGSIKPAFPNTVNKYEADAKWSEFKANVEAKYDIILEEGKPFAVDKENHHKKVSLADLLKQDSNITELLQGRQQKGTGANPADMIDVEGLQIKVKKGATTEELSNQAREYLEKELGDRLHPKFGSEMLKLLVKMKEAAK